jgi:predicted Zn finger-like uncharacterized protein
MDVRCSRCGTEYDFDDALVSERGTTVKCTNCGHQFKVYPGGGGGAPERWIVRKNSGRELVYTSLRDLQRAIAQRQVGPSDLLSRGGGHPLRALGAIAELEPFFQAHGPAVGGTPEAAQRTLLGTGGRPPLDERPTQQWVAPEPQVAQQSALATPAGGVIPPRRSQPLAPPKSSPVTGSDPFAAQELEPATQPRHLPPLIPNDPPGVNPAFDELPSGNAPQIDGITASFRAYQDSFSDEAFPVPRANRQPALRWVVGIVLVGGLAFVAGTVGMKYARKLSAAPAASAKAADPRVVKLVEDGEAFLLKGDFESAKEQVDKASVLAENDLAVLSLTARLEASRADAHWLALKLIEPTHTAELEVERAELGTRLPRVKKTADAAAAVSAGEPSVIRARVDALRLAGDVTAARKLVGALGSDASQPETAYVLAALDLAEASPAWPTVIDRLRAAASAERGVGRARAALVYALASSGANDDATAELAKMDASGSAQSGLVARLRAFVQRLAGTPPGASATAAGAQNTVLAGAVSPRAPGAAAEGNAEASKGTDFRRLLEDAAAAKRSGDLGRAEALYRAAKEQQPTNVEAMAGLGDIARLRGDSATATGYYDSVLHQNPTYLPALIASADLKWANGDRVGALFLYKRIVNQTDPGSAYAQRAAQRIAEAQPGGTAAGATTPPAPQEPAAPSKPPAEHAAPKPAAPADTPTDIDTTDLPGFK